MTQEKEKGHNTVPVAALICVAVTSLFLMYMNNKVIDILASPSWCSKALQAEKISSQNFGGLTACNDLLTIQLKSLATNSHIQSGTIALCLLVLIVIVIAGGRLNFSASKSGVNTSIGKDVDPVQAAQTTADAAQEKATEIAAEAPLPEPPGAKP